MKVWKTDIQKMYKMDPEIFISEFTKKTDFISSIKKHTPNILKELEGIADGAGIDFNTMYAFQLVDEFWVIGPELAQNRCTSFGVKKSIKNPSFTAQTLDIPFFHGYQTLIHMKDPKNDMETFLLTFPGFVAANGMNDRPVSVCVNAISIIALLLAAPSWFYRNIRSSISRVGGPMKIPFCYSDLNRREDANHSIILPHWFFPPCTAVGKGELEVIRRLSGGGC